MKTAFQITLTILTLALLILPIRTFATELDSTNYKLIGVSTSGGGGIGAASNYKMISTAGEISADPRTYSTNYRMNVDPSAMFVAAQPSIQCFETDTTGTTNCTSGPSELLSGGMTALCGPDGCYDRARFEIEVNNNPDDTLYGIEISNDGFISDIKCIDGSTFYPKSVANCNINDFRTETDWETEVFNIKGIISNTTYTLRVTALHGDFTQSDYSKTSSATTADGSIDFDIDIANTGGTITETDAPYNIYFNNSQVLIAGASAVTSENLIWLDANSSSYGGLSIIQFGKYGGLYSATTSQTITSSSENLDTVGNEGFGLQSYYTNSDTSSSYLGEISIDSNYSGTTNNVGEVTTSAKRIYYTDAPLKDGRMGIYLKARADSNKNPATDYSEEIYFVVVPMY